MHVDNPAGHTLDPVITKGLNISRTVKNFALSDNCSVFFDVFMSQHIQNRCMTVRRES